VGEDKGSVGIYMSIFFEILPTGVIVIFILSVKLVAPRAYGTTGVIS
jgi:hypothetical protein